MHPLTCIVPPCLSLFVTFFFAFWTHTKVSHNGHAYKLTPLLLNKILLIFLPFFKSASVQRLLVPFFLRVQMDPSYDYLLNSPISDATDLSDPLQRLFCSQCLLVFFYQLRKCSLLIGSNCFLSSCNHSGIAFESYVLFSTSCRCFTNFIRPLVNE